jgi:hypothetical protein
MNDYTLRLVNVADTQRANDRGTYAKVKMVTYYVGAFGPFTDEVADDPSWEMKAQQKMQEQATKLRVLGG